MFLDRSFTKLFGFHFVLFFLNPRPGCQGCCFIFLGRRMKAMQRRATADSDNHPTTSLEIDGETVETVSDLIFLGSKITTDGDCSHEIKRHLLLGRKVMTNLDSIFKSTDITLPVNKDDFALVQRPGPGLSQESARRYGELTKLIRQQHEVKGASLPRSSPGTRCPSNLPLTLFCSPRCA